MTDPEPNDLEPGRLQLMPYEPPTTTQIVQRSDLRNRTTDSWTDVLEDVGDLAQRIAGTDFVPDTFKGNVPAVAATILTGRELGFAPMTALASLHSIKGKVGLSAEAMRALVLQAGHEIVTTQSTSQVCRMKGRRRDSTEWTEVAWTEADARQAGLLGGSGWKNYPRQMLQARASAELCRLAFPDVIRGLASLEEIDSYDLVPGDATGQTPATEPAKVKRARKTAAAPKAETPAPDLPAPPEPPPTPDAPDVPDAPPLPDPSSPPPPTPGESDSPLTDGAAAGDDIPVATDGGEEPEPGPQQMNQGQRSLIMVHFNRLGISERDERIKTVCALIGRPVESPNELTRDEASAVLDTLAQCRDAKALEDVLTASAHYSTLPLEES